MDESGGSEPDNQTSELRQRHTQIEPEIEDVFNEKEIERLPSDSEAEAESVQSVKCDTEKEKEPKVIIPRVPRNLQIPQRPSFITRQYRSAKNFFTELIDFIFLFFTTLFNPMADVNDQVQEYNQRRSDRNGRSFSSSCKPSSFPGCGPSS